MPDMGAGPRIHKNGTGVTSLTLTPQTPYSALVHKILIDMVSAAGTWTFTIAGQEVATFRIDTLGNQQLLGAATGAFPDEQDLFSFCANVLGDPLTYSINTGQSLVITCDGTITADITIVYEEGPQGWQAGTGLNVQGGHSWYAPLYAALAASQTTTGEELFDTQYGLSFVPGVLKGGTLQAGWNIDIVGFFLEGASQNTYSGSADHISNTNYVAIIKNGQRLATRDAAAGIPLVGSAAATGSANTVYKSDYTPYPAFQVASPGNWRPLDPPLTLRPGDTTNFYLATTGDVTGGADYSHALQVALCKIREVV